MGAKLACVEGMHARWEPARAMCHATLETCASAVICSKPLSVLHCQKYTCNPIFRILAEDHVTLLQSEFLDAGRSDGRCCRGIGKHSMEQPSAEYRLQLAFLHQAMIHDSELELHQNSCGGLLLAQRQMGWTILDDQAQQ